MIPQWATNYIGIPFEDTEEPSRSGTNCWGLTRLLYREQLHIELPSLKQQYGSSFFPKEIDRVIREQIEQSWLDVQIPIVLDLVILRMLSANSHVGVMLDKRYFLHTHESSSSEQGDLNSIAWNKRITGYYRYKDRIVNALRY